MSRKILYIDDYQDNIDVVAILLKKEGYQVLAATDIESGYDLALAQKPDLIILDWHIPHTSGTNTIQQFKMGDLQDIPILILTADTYTFQESMKAGADAYLNKPIKVEILKEKIETLLGN